MHLSRFAKILSEVEGGYVANETSANVNVFFDDLKVTKLETPIRSHTDYYPFGYTISGLSGESAGTNPNRYLYNGKELQSDEFNGISLNTYDYGARQCDPTLGRWLVVDPLSEKLPNWTPYRYALNNPIKYIDLLGQIEWPLNGVQAVNKKDVANGGFGLTNTVVIFRYQ